jgi:D-tagatose-1,6-bisphosphate aldolase subunit GatZ/KbaZ
MSINHLLDRIIESKNKGQAIGITSICSSNPFVIRAGLQQALKHGAPVLIESTCNQVNQFGGYSGMTPAGFVRYVKSIADQEAFPYQQLILGGDHLGPFPWQHEIGEIAMQKAVELVRKYVLVGYTKLHLDASMALSGEDATQKLPPKLAARRTAQLARSSEDACREIGVSPELLRYVIGTEVPAPGGIQRRPDEYPVVSSVAEVEETIQLTRLAFEEQHLHEAWERVSAVVVHAGVEFGDDLVFDYDPSETLKLTKFIETQPNLIYEAHSTDYQTAVGLEQMVAGHFAILKVGPALTFALREALLALEMMETELFGGCEEGKLSQLSRTLESC